MLALVLAQRNRNNIITENNINLDKYNTKIKKNNENNCIQKLIHKLFN